MFYTRILLNSYLLLFVISGCSFTPVDSNKPTQKSIEKNVAVQSLSEQYLHKYKEALYALKNNKLEKSKSILTEIIENNPSIAGPVVNLGLIYYKQKEVKKAILTLKKALLLNPQNPYTHNVLANAFISQGKFTLAENHFLQAIKNKNDYYKAHYNLALLYDIYFHEIIKSIHHYHKYLSIIKKNGFKDQKTMDWVEQLENSISRTKNNV